MCAFYFYFYFVCKRDKICQSKIRKQPTVCVQEIPQWTLFRSSWTKLNNSFCKKKLDASSSIIEFIFITCFSKFKSFFYRC